MKPSPPTTGETFTHRREREAEKYDPATTKSGVGNLWNKKDALFGVEKKSKSKSKTRSKPELNGWSLEPGWSADEINARTQRLGLEPRERDQRQNSTAGAWRND